ncbi:MAG: hypothetical protein IPM82_24715 [Saprospiraceae bacterium]|nr:hypothetical protein [Saprospiraceae bacterium]
MSCLLAFARIPHKKITAGQGLTKPMTKKEILQLLENRFQLEMIRIFREEFEEKEGKSGVLERIDRLLDEINELKKKLETFDNN